MPSGALAYARSDYYASFAGGEFVTVDTISGVDLGRFVCLREIGGHPCIAYYDATDQDLKFAIRY